MIEPLKVQTRCRSCDARVIWTRTENGKKMQVNADPVASGNLVLSGDPEHPLARVVTRDEQAANLLKFYVSHFATCPDAKTWRGKHR
jgi:hypothetical protein